MLSKFDRFPDESCTKQPESEIRVRSRLLLGVMAYSDVFLRFLPGDPINRTEENWQRIDMMYAQNEQVLRRIEETLDYQTSSNIDQSTT